MTRTLTLNGRLPGVVCQATLPPGTEDPLRLDVTALVGFAERGPLDTPVAIEDISQYRTLFGGDLAVAREGGKPVYAQLPAAVQAFFDNGGRRCYVVRIAGEEARCNRFRLPGLVSWSETNGYRAMVAPAAWVGRWSDAVTVGTQLRSQPLPISPMMQAPLPAELAALPGLKVIVEPPTEIALRNGDLLRLSFAGESGLQLFFPIRQIHGLGPAATSLRGQPLLLVTDAAVAQASSTASPSPLPTVLAVARLDAEGWQPLEGGASADLSSLPEAGALALGLPVDANVATGDLLRVSCSGNRVLFLPVTALGLQHSMASPPSPPQLQVISSWSQWQHTLTGPDLPPGLEQVDLLAFDLVVREGDEALETWPALRFAPGSGYWADVLGRPLDNMPVTSIDVSGRQSLRLRAPAEALAVNDSVPLFLPLGMAPLPDPGLFAGPLPGAADEGHDGLEEFDPVALFLDPQLQGVGRRNLMNEAEFLLYLSDRPTSLRKLHSLIAVEEIGLVAVPDLAHRPWGPPQPLPVAELALPEPAPPLDWTRFRDCPAAPVDGVLEPEQVIRLFFDAWQSEGEGAASAYLSPAFIGQLGEDSLQALLGVDQVPASVDVHTPPCDTAGSIKAAVQAVTHLGNGVDLTLLFELIWLGRWAIDGISPQMVALAQPDGLRRLSYLPVLVSPEEYRADGGAQSALLEVHQALVSLCAARADLVAVLGLPEHFTKQDVLDWQVRLTAAANGQQPDALSYAAVYHPWLQIREEVTPDLAPLRHVSPVGAACDSGSPVSPEREAILDLIDEIGQDKFNALLEMMLKRGAGPWVLLTSDRVAALKGLLKNVSSQDLRALAEDPSKSPPVSLEDLLADIGQYTAREKKVAKKFFEDKAVREAAKAAARGGGKEADGAGEESKPGGGQGEGDKDGITVLQGKDHAIKGPVGTTKPASTVTARVHDGTWQHAKEKPDIVSVDIFVDGAQKYRVENVRVSGVFGSEILAIPTNYYQIVYYLQDGLQINIDGTDYYWKQLVWAKFKEETR